MLKFAYFVDGTCTNIALKNTPEVFGQFMTEAVVHIDV